LTVVPGTIEYVGYDDGGTPDDESDDNHLYYLRWYALYSGRNSSWGKIWLYDPDLVKVQGWGVPMLACVVHGWNDGLVANPDGEVHGVVIPVPVSVMEKAGTYRFVLHFYDDYADSYKNHQVKVALEVNRENPWYPITYHTGTYADSKWYVAWCRAPRMVHKKTFYDSAGTNVIGKVKDQTPKGSGRVAAGVNGGFFATLSELIGEVGTDSGWQGKTIPWCRWAFGMDEKGWGHIIDRMKEVSPSSYGAPETVKKFKYGLSGIGALIYNGEALLVKDDNRDGKVDDDAWFMDDDNDEQVDEDQRDKKDNDKDGKVDEDPEWPDVLSKRPRTALAWGADEKGTRYFFLIVAENWTWNETVQFCQNELPKLVKSEYPKIQIYIRSAVMLDGGSSVKFLWRHAPKKGEPQDKPNTDGYQSDPYRNVPTYVLVWADWP